MKAFNWQIAYIQWVIIMLGSNQACYTGAQQKALYPDSQAAGGGRGEKRQIEEEEKSGPGLSF